MTTLDSLVCSKCNLVMGYIIYERWIDYDMVMCKKCTEKAFKKMLKGEK